MARRIVLLSTASHLVAGSGAGADATMGQTASQICEATATTPPEMQDWVDVSEPTVTTAAGVTMPRLIYGTAWKETRVGPGATARLVAEAVRAGFTGIDTACQPKHYHKPGVGEGLKQMFAEGVARETLFIQTKFSRNQDLDTIPYSVTASIPAQVAESVCKRLSVGGICLLPAAASQLSLSCQLLLPSVCSNIWTAYACPSTYMRACVCATWLQLSPSRTLDSSTYSLPKPDMLSERK